LKNNDKKCGGGGKKGKKILLPISNVKLKGKTSVQRENSMQRIGGKHATVICNTTGKKLSSQRGPDWGQVVGVSLGWKN